MQVFANVVSYGLALAAAVCLATASVRIATRSARAAHAAHAAKTRSKPG